MKLWRARAASSRGGFRHGKLGPHKDFVLAAIEARSDITMPELAEALERAKSVKVDPSR
jgi:hypothetical protein